MQSPPAPPSSSSIQKLHKQSQLVEKFGHSCLLVMIVIIINLRTLHRSSILVEELGGFVLTNHDHHYHLQSKNSTNKLNTGGRIWRIFEGYPFDSVANERVAMKFGDGEEHKRESEEEEEQTKRYVAFEGTKPHEEGEHCPCKQENPQRRVDVLGVSRRCFVSFNHAEPRDEERGVREPESAIGSESGGAEGIAGYELPHACDKLCQSSVENRETNDHVRR